MQYTEVMVRYGELSTKGKNRRNFINRLATNVRNTLLDFSNLEIKASRDRMHIKLNGEDFSKIKRHLMKVFGIQNFYPVIKLDKDLETVKKAAKEIVSTNLKSNGTFKINTRRSDHDYEYDTNQLNYLIGEYILKEVPNVTVKMKEPDLILRVEVRRDGIYLSHELINGAGGLPVGTAGKAVLMLSGGIDSPVAGYLAMKRGVDIEMVHFYSPPYTSELALNKAKDLTVKLTPYVGRIRFIQVPFSKIQETIKQNVPEGYLMTVQRRLMLRLSERIAEKRKALAIFNGESLGQVASQTLESMAAINDVTTMPVLRPVLSMDKNEIIKVAKKIDTFDLSIMPFEDCCTIFAPPAPKTKPRIDKARFYEERLDISALIKEALDGIEITDITNNAEFLAQYQKSFNELL